MTRTRTERFLRSCAAGMGMLADACAVIARLPYFRIYRKGTLEPALPFCSEKDDASLPLLLGKWQRVKKKELEYVQVSGAVMFATAISFLSWNGFDDRHWTASAFGYSSVACSLTAIVLGSQQLLVLDDLDDKTAIHFRDSLTVRDTVGANRRPRRLALYIWQIPVQCLAYAVVSLVIGFVSFVVSPLAMSVAWDRNAKTVLVFGLAALFALLNFTCCSLWVMRMAY